jgi:hypothetical protein
MQKGRSSVAAKANRMDALVPIGGFHASQVTTSLLRLDYPLAHCVPETIETLNQLFFVDYLQATEHDGTTLIERWHLCGAANCIHAPLRTPF